MRIEVETAVGFCGAAEPTSFCLGRRRLQVRAVVDRWHSATMRWVKVDADDGRLYVLRLDTDTGSWELVALTHPGGAPAGPAASLASPAARGSRH